LQSHHKLSPAESSTKGPPIPEASYIAPSPDSFCCPRSSPGETTTLPPSQQWSLRQEPDLLPKIRNTTYISPPHALWILYKEIEGDLAAAQYTGTEIREYISDLQSHNEPRSPGISTKCLAILNRFFSKISCLLNFHTSYYKSSQSCKTSF
jgi:hypothetical protein